MKLVVLLQGVVLLLQMFLNGFILVMLGPSLPDLQCLLNVDLETASYLFLFLTLGIISSMSVSGCMVVRYNPYLLLCLLLLTQTLAISTLTFSGNIYIASSITLVIGSCTGLQLCLILHVKECLWPGTQRATHVIFAVASFGSVMCPLILNPFLSDGAVTVSYKHRSEIHHDPNRRNVDHDKPSMNETGYLKIFEANDTIPADMSSSACEDFKTLIQFPYLLMSLIEFPVVIVLMLLYRKTKQHDFSIPSETLQESDDKKKPGKVYLFFMFLFFLQGQGYPSGLSGMLTTYGINGLNVRLTTMTLMTSFFWLMFMFGRMLPSLLPQGFKQSRIIEVTLVGNFIGTALLVGTVFGGEAFLWSSCLFLGLCTGPGLPAGLTWSGEVIYLTPNIKALFLVSASCGIVIPYLCGMLIDVFGENVFVYFFVGFYLENVVVYFIVKIMIKYGKIGV